MGYKNFKVAVYFTNYSLQNMDDISVFAKEFAFIEKHVDCDKVYLETFRGNILVDKQKIIKVKDFFLKKGINVSGGITTTITPNLKQQSICYSRKENRKRLIEVIQLTASLFDEIILDDFFFTNCRCTECVKQKGKRTWTEFRLQLMKQVSRNMIIKTAKRVNPDVNLIIKYPNWYDDYHNLGYNLVDQPALFDMIYTGTETRDPKYTRQNLQRYLSYFLMRYLENVKPGKNGGGWFDSFDCLYNLGSYVEQIYLTLFAKAREITLFCFNMLVRRNAIFIPLAGYVLSKVDTFLDKLGKPTGISCYKPYHSEGEDYLFNYLGMLGLPLEPIPDFPEKQNVILLTGSAKKDKKIVNKIKLALGGGKRVIITSGLLKVLQEVGFKEIADIIWTDKKQVVKKYACTMFECSYKEYYNSSDDILIPWIEYNTNDCWALISAFNNSCSYPILLEMQYGNGHLNILTIPDNFSNLYNLPPAVLNRIRQIFLCNSLVYFKGPSQITLFIYDNNTFVIESFLPNNTEIDIIIRQKNVKLLDVIRDQKLIGRNVQEGICFKVHLYPTTYKIFEIIL